MNKKPKLIRMVTHDMGFRELLNGQLNFLNSKDIFEVIGLSSDTGELKNIAEKEGVRTISVHMNREISLFHDFKSLIALYKTFRKEKPDVVHANTPKAVLLGMTAAWLARVPNRIYTVTGLRFETATGKLRFILKSMERISCRFATRVIPEGDGVANTLVREKITKKPLRKILHGNINGVDLNFFTHSHDVEKAAGYIRKEGKLTFVFVGRVVKDKGVQELVEAFVNINNAFPDSRLLIVGRLEQHLDPLPLDIIKQIEQNENIEWVGFQTDVRPWMAAADVLVLPSYREGFPNVVLQACAMGLPCIVTDVNGCNEVISHGVNGFLVQPKDAAALEKAMLHFVKNKSLAKDLGSSTRQIIIDKFSNDAIWEATLQMYLEELRKRPSKRR